MTNTSTRASDTPDAILDTAEESAIPDIGYGSEAEALAAQERRERAAFEAELARQQNELEAQRRAAAEAAAQTEAEAAATAAQAEAATAGGTPNFYPVGPETVTEYSGSIGVIEKRADLAGIETFFYHLGWSEVSNRPCDVSLIGTDGVSMENVSFECGSFWSSSRSVNTAMKIPVYAIQVCNNTRNSKRRLKGIRIWGVKINPDGTTVPANVNDEEELANCSRWASRRECPNNQIATGVVVMTKDAGGDSKADITGLRLICHAIGVR